MDRLPSIKQIRSISNTSGCCDVLVRRPIPLRDKTLAGTKVMNCSGGELPNLTTFRSNVSDDKWHHRLLGALLLAPVIIFFGFMILAALFR